MRRFFIVFSAALLSLTASAISVTIDQETVANGAVINVSHVPSFDPSYEVAQYDLQGTISSTSGSVLLNVTRSEVAQLVDPFEDFVYDSFCISECMTGNGELTQSYTFTGVGANNVMHITCPAVPGKEFRYTYQFTDGSESLTMTVVYSGAMAVENVVAESHRQGVYSIFGQQLRADNNTEGLSAGMYIVGGKKVMVK